MNLWKRKEQTITKNVPYRIPCKLFTNWEERRKADKYQNENVSKYDLENKYDFSIFLQHHLNVVRFSWLHTHKTKRHRAGDSLFFGYLVSYTLRGREESLIHWTGAIWIGSLGRQMCKADWFSWGVLLPAGDLPVQCTWPGQCLCSDWPLFRSPGSSNCPCLGWSPFACLVTFSPGNPCGLVLVSRVRTHILHTLEKILLHTDASELQPHCYIDFDLQSKICACPDWQWLRDSVWYEGRKEFPSVHVPRCLMPPPTPCSRCCGTELTLTYIPQGISYTVRRQQKPGVTCQQVPLSSPS